MPGRQVVPRDMHAGNLRIIADYFADPPIYNDKFFQRRFRMAISTPWVIIWQMGLGLHL
jgi:hypothetical protein